MIGTIVNAAAVLIGGLIGVLLRKGIPERVADAVMKGMALCVLYIGLTSALEGQKTLAAILAVAVGAVLGTAMDLDGKLVRLGNALEKKIAPSGGVALGFVTASLLFCVGAMAVVGSLQSGLSGDNEMLFTKSTLDFISSIVMGATLGIGVALSSVVLFIYQGAITLLAGALAPVLTEGVIAEMTCVGGLLIVGLGFNMLGMTKLKVMDYVPAIFIVIGLYYIVP